MNQAFYTGLSGMQIHQTGIDVTADNLASINTVGFRGYSTEFETIFNDAMSIYEASSNLSDTVGYGVRIGSIAMNETQGTMILTDSSTDLAIDGDGWFGVVNEAGDSLYTRSGAFTTDAQYNLVSRNEGMHVLGTLGNNFQNGILTAEQDEIPLTEVSQQVPLSFPQNLYYPPQPTTEVNFFGNLSVEEDSQIISSMLIAANNDKNTLQLEFTKSDPQPDEGTSWDVTAKITAADGSTVLSEESGVVTFDSTGALASNTLTTIDNGGTAVTINMGTGYDGLISTSQTAITSYSTDNGIPSGELVGYDVNVNGIVTASFTNGRSSAIANIALYHFTNDQGLDRISGTHFAESANSGKPIFYKDGAGNVTLGATILNNKLENSNVKMEVGMTELIILQRAYAANAKSVTTGDELVQKALNMDA